MKNPRRLQMVPAVGLIRERLLKTVEIRTLGANMLIGETEESIMSLL